MEQKLVFNERNLADVYAGRPLSPCEQLIMNDIHFKLCAEALIRAYVDSYYFILEVQRDRKRADAFNLSSNTIRRVLEMMVECEFITRNDAITVYSICKYIGSDMNIKERMEGEWI